MTNNRQMHAMGSTAMHIDRIAKLRRRLLIYVAAGPAANLLSVFVTVSVVSYIFPSLGESWIAGPATQFVLLSLIFTLVGVLPIAKASDASRIQLLLRNPPGASRLLSIYALSHQHHQGIRPRLWKRTWLDRATSLCDNTPDEFHANLLAYVSANDRKDDLAASHFLERCLELSSSLTSFVRDHLATEAAVFCAWFRHDADLASHWEAQIKRRKKLEYLNEIRLSVALQCASNQFEGALTKWADGLTFIEQQPETNANGTLRNSWLEWRDEIRDRQKQLPIRHTDA